MTVFLLPIPSPNPLTENEPLRTAVQSTALLFAAASASSSA